MPRRQKPPGQEKWTWDEINAGRKMFKTEKRYRKTAVVLGATKSEGGRIQPPSFGKQPVLLGVFYRASYPMPRGPRPVRREKMRQSFWLRFVGREH